MLQVVTDDTGMPHFGQVPMLAPLEWREAITQLSRLQD